MIEKLKHSIICLYLGESKEGRRVKRRGGEGMGGMGREEEEGDLEKRVREWMGGGSRG